MSNTITIPGIRKFFKSLTYKERNAIQRLMDAQIAEIMGTPGHPLMDELACNMIYVAARRLNRDDVTHDSIEAMTVEELDELTRDMMEALGFPDDIIDVDDEGVPLVLQDSQTESEETEKTKNTEDGSSAQENSSTSTSTALSQDGK